MSWSCSGIGSIGIGSTSRWPTASPRQASRRNRVFRSGQKRGVHGQIKKELRRRSAIEAVIGHNKTDGQLDRNFLKGRLGDQINAIMSAVGYNFRLILK